MSEERFWRWMHAVDEEDLQEAMQAPKQKYQSRRVVVAAGICLCVLCIFLCSMLFSTSGGGMQVVEAEELKCLGYDMPLPTDASDITYYLASNDDVVPMAQVEFCSKGVSYVYRAQITEQPEFSGDDKMEALVLEEPIQNQSLYYGHDENMEYISWYHAEQKIQWWIGSVEKKAKLLVTAADILSRLGLHMDVAPPSAEAVTYQVLQEQGMSIAETRFLLKGNTYVYRTASTHEVSAQFPDISGVQGDFMYVKNTRVGWCDAVLSYTKGQNGVLIWFDRVPGLVYSLTMEQGASEHELLEMAELLFEPVQDDVQ